MLRKQHKVDDSHYDMPLIYYTEGYSLHFGRPEFALITSLPFGTVNSGLYTFGEPKFRNRVFPHKLGLSVTNLDVIGVIEDEETFRKLCDQDSIRLCLILALEVIFMEKHSDEHYFGMKKDRMYVPTYTLAGFVFAFQLEKSRKRAHSSFRVSSSVCMTDPKKWLKDEVICELNVRVFKLETIIQVLARERNEEYGDFVVEDELRFVLGKLTHSKRNHVDIVPGKTNQTVSWVKINKHHQNINDPSLLDLLKKVKPWVEDLSRLFHSFDTVWLTPDIERFISQQGHVNCKFPWSDDYTVGRNLWLTLACLDPSRKGWLSEEHIDLWVDYIWHGRPDNANWAMDYELEKCRELMKSISDTQLKVLKKISFIAKLVSSVFLFQSGYVL
ncbi:hypothetical protein Tco_0105503 [Tanacetum coccineum]